MDAKRMALVAAGVAGAGIVAASMAALALGLGGATFPVAGSSLCSCCCCNFGIFVPMIGLVGVALAAKKL